MIYSARRKVHRAPGLMQKFWDIAAYYRITSFSGVPTVYASRLQAPRQGRDLTSIEYGIYLQAGARPQRSRQHVLGSSALPPSFPAVPIEGEYYWDGGIYSNSPIEVAFYDYPRQSSVVFATQIWRTRGPRPELLAQALMREKDILLKSLEKPHLASISTNSRMMRRI